MIGDSGADKRFLEALLLLIPAAREKGSGFEEGPTTYILGGQQ